MTGPHLSEAELLDLFERCSNWGRWGEDDELGTLNLVTAQTTLRAVRTVTRGVPVSLGADLSTERSSKNPRPVIHQMLYEQHQPESALDFVGVAPHGFAVTHLDAVGHVYFQNRLYNGRAASDAVRSDGLAFGSIHAMRDGIVTRGVLLDVAAARGVPWLAPGDYVRTEDLIEAERLSGVQVESGDAVFVHVGLQRWETEHGPEDATLRAGLHAECLPWLLEREVAVYSGDCVERMPYPSRAVPLPLHQIGLAAMGLCLLDCPRLTPLLERCHRFARHEFLLILAPLRLPGGTGSPVNPIAVF